MNGWVPLWVAYLEFCPQQLQYLAGIQLRMGMHWLLALLYVVMHNLIVYKSAKSLTGGTALQALKAIGKHALELKQV